VNSEPVNAYQIKGQSAPDDPEKLTKGDFSRVGYGVLFLISLAGLLDASYLSWVHLSVSQTCIAGSGCSAVLATSYAVFIGIPVAAIGAGMYLVLAIFSVRILRAPEKGPGCEPWLFAISLTGVLASTYLTALQAFVIGEWCPFCLLSAGLIAAFFSLCLYGCLKTGSLGTAMKHPGMLRQNLPAAVLALILPSLVILAVDNTFGATDRKKTASGEQIVGIMGERRITLTEVDEAIQIKLQQIEAQRYSERKAFLETELIEMEADQRGMTPSALLQREVVEKITVGQDEIQQFIEANRARLPKLPLPVLKEKIENLLRGRKTEDARGAYVERLKEKHGAQFTLPLPPRLTIDANPRGGPVTGPVNAPVTIIEFSDFECPFCGKTHQTLEELTHRYPGKIRLAFRHFPLEQHRKARQIAEFSNCAHQQDLFWPFADRVFAQQGGLSVEKLYVIARQVGLDTELFSKCIEAGGGRQAVARDIAEGKDWGLRSTPSLFINGRYFSGLPKDLDGVIEEELAIQ